MMGPRANRPSRSYLPVEGPKRRSRNVTGLSAMDAEIRNDTQPMNLKNMWRKIKRRSHLHATPRKKVKESASPCNVSEYGAVDYASRP
jgi:hypothetical protein